MNKIKEVIDKIKFSLAPKAALIDAKFRSLIPNDKLRKISYIAVGGFLSLMVLLVLLGLIVSSSRRSDQTGFMLNKPKIKNSTPEPQKELTEMQKRIQVLQNEINNMKFPPSILNIPVIESEIQI